MDQRLDSPTVRLPHQPQQIPPQLRLRLAHLVVRLEPPHRFRVLAPRLHQGTGDRETGAPPAPPSVQGKSSWVPIGGISVHELNTCATPWRRSTSPCDAVNSSALRSSTA